MVFRPEVFLSATPVELDAYREVVRKVLNEMGAKLVEQRDYTVAYGPLQGLLYQQIRRCEAVIHLAGRSYGLEPQDRTSGDPRRSFAQYELDVARSAGKVVFSFLTAPDAPVAGMPPEDEERIALQREHRAAIERSGDLVQTFRDSEELARQIRALRPRIMVRRQFAGIPRAAMGERFFGRRHLIERIVKELDEGATVVLHPPLETGAAESGAGRTALAFEVAWRLHESGHFPFVFTLPGGPTMDLEVALAALARSDALGIVPDEIGGHRIRLNAVLEWFRREENAGKWLLVVDGVDESVNWLRVRKILEDIGAGPVLVTSRIQTWPDMVAHAVGPWGLEQAGGYVLERTMPGRAHSRSELAAAERLAESLDRLPLALEIVTAKLQEGRKTPAEFLAQSAAVSFAQVVERSVVELDDFSRALLRQLACLAPQPAGIPFSLFDNRGDTEQIRASIGLLQRLGLLCKEDDGRSMSIHRRVRQVLIDHAPATERDSALGAALATLDGAFRRSGSQSGVLQELLVPHGRVLLGQLNGHPLELHASSLVSSLARWLQDVGRPSEAEPLFRRALSIDEKRFGPKHSEVVRRLRDLAGNLRMRGRSKEGESLNRRALEISEAAFGKQSSEIVADLYQVAGSLRAQHHLQQAEELYRRALEIEEKHSGRSHPRVAVALHRLAGLYEVSRRWIEAEAMYRRAIAIDEAAVGPTHPRVIGALYNLSAVLAVSRRGPEAEALLQRALEHDERTFGSDHMEITPGLRLLAEMMDRRGAVAEAEALWRRIIAADEATFGADYPEVAADRLALAALLYNESRSAEARSIVEDAIRVLVATGKRLRRRHPYLPSAFRLYREILKDLGVPEEEISAECDVLQGGVKPDRIRTAIFERAEGRS